MKKPILTLMIIIFISGSITTLYAHINDNKSFYTGIYSQNTHSNMTDPNQDVRETRKYAFSVYHKFLTDAEIKIKQNKICFTQYKVMLSKKNQKDKASCMNLTNGLEQKNIKLKKMLAIQKTDQRQYKWTTNTMDFNHDMNQLETMMWSID